MREFFGGDFYWSLVHFQVKDPEVTGGTYLQLRENPPPVPPTRLPCQENGDTVSIVSCGIPLNQESIKSK